MSELRGNNNIMRRMKEGFFKEMKIKEDKIRLKLLLFVKLEISIIKCIIVKLHHDSFKTEVLRITRTNFTMITFIV